MTLGIINSHLTEATGEKVFGILCGARIAQRGKSKATENLNT